MGLDGSPKKFAEDVASGLISINRATLKRYTPVEIQKIMSGLMTVGKELRTLVVDSGDFNGLKDKGMKNQRINGAMHAIRAYAKENKFNV
jgi:hypothetical protein